MENYKTSQGEIFRSLMKNPETSKLIKEAINSPFGSTSRARAKKVLSIIDKLNVSKYGGNTMDGEGGPGMQYQRMDSQPMSGYGNQEMLPDMGMYQSPQNNLKGMVIFKRIPTPKITYGGSTASKNKITPSIDGSGWPGIINSLNTTFGFNPNANYGIPKSEPTTTQKRYPNIFSGISNSVGNFFNKIITPPVKNTMPLAMPSFGDTDTLKNTFNNMWGVASGKTPVDNSKTILQNYANLNKPLPVTTAPGTAPEPIQSVYTKPAPNQPVDTKPIIEAPIVPTIQPLVVKIEEEKIKDVENRNIVNNNKITFRFNTEEISTTQENISTSGGVYSNIVTPNKLRDIIAAQESGGVYTTPPNSAGAMGRYQFIPSTLALYGVDVSTPEKIQAFLNNPTLQDQTFDRYITDLAKQYGRNLGKMLAAYYGGAGGANVLGTEEGDTYGKVKNGKPTGYPSINEYVAQVFARIGGNTTQKTTINPNDIPTNPVQKAEWLTRRRIQLEEEMKGLEAKTISEIVEKDTFLKTTNKQIDGYLNEVMNATDLSNPANVMKANSTLSYLYSVRGMQNESYAGFLKNVIDQHQGRLNTAVASEKLQWDILALNGSTGKAAVELAKSQEFMNQAKELDTYVIDKGKAIPGFNLVEAIRTLPLMNSAITKDGVLITYSNGIKRYLNSPSISPAEAKEGDVTDARKSQVIKDAINNFAALRNYYEQGDVTTGVSPDPDKAIKAMETGSSYLVLLSDDIARSIKNKIPGFVESIKTLNPSGIGIGSLRIGIGTPPTEQKFVDTVASKTGDSYQESTARVLYAHYKRFIEEPINENVVIRSAAAFVESMLKVKTTIPTDQPFNPSGPLRDRNPDEVADEIARLVTLSYAGEAYQDLLFNREPDGTYSTTLKNR